MADHTDLLSQLKIAKNTYLFNLRRRFSPVEYFQIKKKKADTPLANLLEQMMPKEKPLAGLPRGGASGKGAKAVSSSTGILGTLLKAGAAVVLVILLFSLWILLNAHPSMPLPAPPAPQAGFNGTLDIRLSDAQLINVGPQGHAQFQPYVLLDYSAASLQALSIDAKVYASPPSRQVFVLRYAHNGADNYGPFRSALQSELSARGWSIVDIGEEDLATLPGGSTLIIPTGYLPASLLGDAQSRTPSVLDLVRRGVVVIYIGLPFDQGVLAQNGVVGVPDSTLLSRMHLEFNTADRPISNSGLRLSNSLYHASSREYPSSLLWGSISTLATGTGFLLLIPENIDVGWTGNGRAAGEDIARLVAEEPYRPVLSSYSWSSASPMPARGPITLFLPSISAPSGTLRLRLTLNDTHGAQEQLVMDSPIQKLAAGELYFDNPVLVPRFLGGGPVSLLASLRETQPKNPCVKLQFELVANGSALERANLEQGCTQVTINKPATIATTMGPGTYLLRLVDGDKHVYAITRVDVADLDLAGPKAGSAALANAFSSGEFNFSFSSQGSPIRVPYVKVDLSGPLRGPPAEFRDTRSITYRYARDYPRGNYTLHFDFGSGYVRDVVYSRALTVNIWERPDVLALALVGALVFGVGFYLRRPEKPLYSLDIPDFPPQSVTRIEMPVSSVLALFSQINRDYAWERMPLKPEELKNGFRKSLQSGKPVLIGDYNLQRLLERLEEKKLVTQSLGYWAPTAWLRESGQSMERLATFRYLRDLFVTNAVRFSKLGALENCDVKILLGPNEYFIHFYSGDDSVIERSLATLPIGRSWILFQDRYQLEKFRQRLNSPSPAALALKMQVDSSNKRARLFALDDMAGLLKRLKVE